MAKEAIRELGDRLIKASQTEIQKEKEKQKTKNRRKHPKTEVQFQNLSIHII